MKDEREKEERKNGNDANDGKMVERERCFPPATRTSPLVMFASRFLDAAESPG